MKRKGLTEIWVLQVSLIEGYSVGKIFLWFQISEKYIYFPIIKTFYWELQYWNRQRTSIAPQILQLKENTTLKNTILVSCRHNYSSNKMVTQEALFQNASFWKTLIFKQFVCTNYNTILWYKGVFLFGNTKDYTCLNSILIPQVIPTERITLFLRSGGGEKRERRGKLYFFPTFPQIVLRCFFSPFSILSFLAIKIMPLPIIATYTPLCSTLHIQYLILKNVCSDSTGKSKKISSKISLPKQSVSFPNNTNLNFGICFPHIWILWILGILPLHEQGLKLLCLKRIPVLQYKHIPYPFLMVLGFFGGFFCLFV